MADWKPLLQIVHVSDIHFDQDPAARPPWFDLWMWRLQRSQSSYLRALGLKMERGTESCDVYGAIEFEAFLRSVANDPEYRGTPTLLVDTGDLTTWGDDRSVADGHHFFRQWANACGPKSTAFSVYGNHDAWPATFPWPLNHPKGWAVSAHDLAQHRLRLRRRWVDAMFPADPAPYPKKPLTPSTVHGGPSVQLYGLNSVVHELSKNVAALGLVAEDRYWDQPARRTSPRPAEQLRRLRGFATGPAGPTLRIVALHHPLTYPADEDGKTPSTWQMHLENADVVRANLAGANGMPPVQLVLCGHSHIIDPAPGELSSAKRVPIAGRPSPLQLSTGALLQNGSSFEASGAPWAHPAAIYRFEYDASGEAQHLRLGRAIAARYSATKRNNDTKRGGFGRYQLIPGLGPGGSPWEETDLQL